MDQNPRIVRGTLPSVYHPEPTTAPSTFPLTPPTSKTTGPDQPYCLLPLHVRWWACSALGNLTGPRHDRNGKPSPL